jgi:hypothetical protein
MRRFAILAGAAALAGCSYANMAANEAANDPNTSKNAGGGGGDPTAYMQIPDIMTAGYDISALKEGEWVEYESKSTAAGTTSASKSRWACVKVEGNTAWVETSAAGYDGWTYLFAVDKGDRKVKKAYAGKSGQDAKEIKVTATGTGGTVNNTNYKVRGTVKISKETLTVKGTAFDCEKQESSTTSTMDGKDYTSKSTSWVSDKVPFRFYWDESELNKKDPNVDIKYEGKPSVRGGYVKTWSEGSGTTSEMNLTGWGTDAKMSVKLPAPK